MNLKRLLLVSFVMIISLLSTGHLADAQNYVQKQRTKEDIKALKKAQDEFLKEHNLGKLRSAAGTTIPSIKDFYCSSESFDDIIPSIPVPEGGGVYWAVSTTIAGEGKLVHEDWYDMMDVAGERVLRFYPSRVDSKYFGNSIVFNFVVFDDRGINVGTAGDITFVYKTPTIYPFGADTEICAGFSATLTLANSESGVNYILQRNGVDIPTELVGGSNGIPITFTVSVAGVYTVKAYTTTCEQMMDGQATVVVHPSPILTTSPDVTICDGQKVTLTVSSNADPDVDYSWSNAANGASIEVSPNTTTTYTVTGTNRITGCKSTKSITVTVNPLPVVDIVNPSPVCEGKPLTLSANVTGGSAPYTFSWSLPGGATQTGPSVNLSPADLSANGVYKLTVTDAKSCGSVEVSTTVVVNPLPPITMTAIPNGPVCQNVPVTFTATGGVNYTFYVNGAVAQASSPVNTFTLANPSNGDVVRVVGDNVNSCEQEDSYTLTVNLLPVSSLSVSPSAVICVGKPLTFTATGGSQYLFYVNGVAQGTWSATNTFVTSSLTNGAVVHARVRTADNCEGDTDPITITINEAQATLVSNPANGINCRNEYFNFTATGGVQYEFSVNGVVVQALGTSNTFAISSLNNNDAVTVRVIDADGCEDISAPIVVKINELPNVNISANPSTPVCPYNTITFTGTGAVQYEFLINGTVVQSLSPTATFLYTNPVNGVAVSVRGVDANGCSMESVDYNVVVNPAPTGTLTVSPSNVVCKGTSVSFTVNSADSDRYRFYVNNVAQGPFSASNIFTTSTLQNGDVVGARMHNIATGCEEVTNTITMTINEATATLTSNPTPAVVCMGDFINFTAGGGVQYEFSVNGVVAQAMSATNTFATATLTNGASVTVRVIDANNCEAVSTPIVVTVNPLPFTSIVANPATPVCPGTPITFTGGGAVQYEFKLNGIVVQPRSNTATYTLATPANGDVVAVVGYNAHNCFSESIDYTVVVNPLPVTTLSVSPSAVICQGKPLTFTATGGSQYLFYVNNNAQGTWSATNTFTTSTLNNGDVVHAKVKSANGCDADTDPIQVTINEANATLTSDLVPAVVCAGDFINFTAGGGVQYEFSVNGAVVQAMSATNTYATATLTNGASVTVRIIDANGCEDISAPIVVTVNSLPFTSITANPSTAVCPNVPITFTGGDAVQYEFKLNGVVVQPRSNTATYTLANPTNGDIVAVVGYNAHNCFSESVDYVVQVHPAPVPTLSVSPSTDACVGEPVIFTAGGGNEYLFFVNGAAQGAWSTNNVFTTSTLANNSVVHVRVRSLLGCEIDSDPLTITVHSLNANISITGPVPGMTTICRSSNVIFSASPAGAANYEFIVTRAGVDTQLYSGNQNIFSTNLLQDGDEVFVKVTDAYNCNALSSKIRVTVVELPVPDFTISPSPLCEGSEVTITATPGFDKYDLFVNGVKVGNSQASNVFVSSALVTGDQVVVVAYDVVNPSLECYGSSAPKTMNFLPLPNIVLSSDQAGDEFCVGSNVTFTAVGGVLYQFHVNGVMVQDFSATNTYTSNSLQNGDVVTVVGEDAVGCQKVSNQIFVVVNEATAVLTSDDADNTICVAQTIHYTASGGVAFEFFVDGVSQGVSANDTYLLTGTAAGTHQIYVVVQDANGCFDTSDIIDIQVLGLPVPVLSVDKPGAVCKNTELTFTASGGAYYVFYVNDVEVQAQSANNVYITSTLNDGDAVHVRVVNNSDCEDVSAKIVVQILELPEITLTSSKGAVPACENESITITASSVSPGMQYEFSVNGAVVQALSASNTLSYSSDADYTVVVRGEDANGCSNVSDPLTISVSAVTPGLSVDENELCYGDFLNAHASGGTNYEFFLNGVSLQNGASDILVHPVYDVGTHVLTVMVTNEHGCSKVSSDEVIIVNGLPFADISSDLTVVCAGEFVTFTASGGDLYEWLVDGVAQGLPVADNTWVHAFDEGTHRVAVNVINGTTGCHSESVDIIITANHVPTASLTASPSLNIIEGQTITFTAGEVGYEYTFFVNAVEVQARSTNNVFASNSLVDGDVVTVYVHDNDCFATASLTVHVLDGIDLLQVIPEFGNYCADGSAVLVQVLNPQAGITYRLVHQTTGDIVGAPIDYQGTGDVSWDYIRIHNLENPSVYYVEAFYPLLPGDIVQMANTVTITENALPNVYQLSPYNATFVGCAAVDELKLVDSQSGVEYQLLLNGNAFGAPIAGSDGVEISFGTPNVVGVYSVRAQNITTGCVQLMDGMMTIEGETVQSFNLSPDPANGNYCENTHGVTIRMDGSEAGVTYLLYRDGVDTGESVVGDGNPVSFSVQSIDGNYTVLIQSGTGCLSPMAGVVVVTKYSLPAQFDVIVDNGGEFCVDGTGVIIHLSGSEVGVTYHLLRNNVATGSTVVGNGAAVSFHDAQTEAGVYSVEATQNDVDCAILMSNNVTVVVNQLPKDFDVIINNSIVCVGDVTTITLLGSEHNVDYTLHHVDSSTDIYTESGTGGRLDFYPVTLEGQYIVFAHNTLTNCDNTLSDIVSLAKVDRPLFEIADVYLEVDAPDPSDDCGLADIYVRNAQEGMIYQLFKQFATALVPVGGQIFTATANPDDNVFTGIADNNGQYHVKVSNGYCEETLDDNVIITTPGAVAVFQVVGDDEICNGDLGVTIGLSGSEVGVTYTLIQVRNSEVMEIVPGTGAAFQFTKLIRNAGTYRVVGRNDVSGCESDMAPLFELKVNPLPIAYRMVGSGNYCTGLGAEIKLESSEFDVTYILQVKDGANFVEADGVSEVRGSGNEISFGIHAPGVYRIIAYNELTLCTSSMEGEITVQQRPTIENISLSVESEFCTGTTGAEMVLNSLQDGVLYELRNQDGLLVTQVIGSATLTQYHYFINKAGTYVLTASYGGDGCLETLQNFEVVETPAPTQKYTVTSDVTNGCGSDGATITLSGSEVGFDYTLYIYNGSNPVETEQLVGTGSPLIWNVTFNGHGTVNYEVIAENQGKCGFLQGSLTISFKPAPAVLYLTADPLEFCASDGGVLIDLPHQYDNDVYYRLFSDGVFVEGIEASATRNQFTGKQTEGIYTIQAVNITTGCSVVMNGQIEVIKNDNPDVTDADFYYVADEDDTNGHNNGMIGVGFLVIDHTVDTYDYTLYVTKIDGSVTAVETKQGTNDILLFDALTLEGGTYHVMVLDRLTGCESRINGTVLMAETPLVAKDGFLTIKLPEVNGTLDVLNADPAMVIHAPGVDKVYSRDGVDADNVNVEFKLHDTFIYTDDKGNNKLYKTVGDVKLNPVSGIFEYTKKVGFYGQDMVKYTVSNTQIPGRDSTAIIYIFVGNQDADENNPFLIPNAFSPNGDGFNDRFVVLIPSYIKEDGFRSKLEVFNRWGTVVYQSKGDKYDNQWDGKSTEAAMVSIGDDLPSGTYFYVFKITFIENDKHVSKELSGYIELRR